MVSPPTSQPRPPSAAVSTATSPAALSRFSATARAMSYESPVSSSMNPRGGQSGSGASQRLEQ